MTISRRLLAVCVAVVVVAGGQGTSSLRASPQAAVAGEPNSVDELLQSANELLKRQQGNRALPLFERALDQARRLGLESQQADALCGIGEVQYYIAQYTPSREHGREALAIYERLASEEGIGRASHLLSLVAQITGDAAAARTFAARAVAAYDAAGHREGRALATLQLLKVRPLPIDEELPLYKRAIDDARAAGKGAIEGEALHSLGDHLFVAARYEEALDYLNEAAAVLEPTGNLVALGTVFNSIGRLYRAHGRLDEALRSQLKALELHQKAGVPFELLQSTNAVATVYHRMGDLTSARTYYERASALADKSGSQRVQDFVRANFAGLLLDRGEYARGAEILESVISNGLDAYSGQRYSQLSFAYLKMGRTHDALIAAGKALDECTRDESVCIDALGRRAMAQTAMGSTDAALSDVNAALAGIEAWRAKLVPLDFFKQEFHRSQEDIYSLAIGLQVREKQDRLALETAELARSRAFLDLLASQNVPFKERDRAELAALREAGQPASRSIDLVPLDRREQTVALTLRGGEAIATIPRPVEAPRASLELRSFVTAQPSAAADLVAIASRLKSTLVFYWVATDETFIWVVTPSGEIHAHRVGVLRSKLVELIHATEPFANTNTGALPAKSVIATRGASAITLQGTHLNAWRELYTFLIAPIRGLLPRPSGSLLTIVPQGPLLGLSFAALQSPQGRYLLEDYTLHYAPAGAVLQFTEPKRRADARSGSMLLVADPVPPRMPNLDRPLVRLPGARSEARAISRLLPANRLTMLQDAKATEALTREAMADKAVLHFATHAIVSDDDPFSSFLALGPSAAAPGDGLLTAGEVYGLDLKADLVVLSACRSAGGRITGDGISAFARAFIYAGTASIAASLWDVADEPTSRLLPDFYRSWLAGASKSSALRSAQLALLRDLRAGRVRVETAAGPVSIPEHPVFWASFVLFGEPD
jgi:CHAT domain-containing protein/tetratricopeptide (TPR) repeat protein